MVRTAALKVSCWRRGPSSLEGPTSGADWGQLTSRLRAGGRDAEHRRIRPDTTGIVPVCPSCGRLALRVRIHKLGYLEFVEPSPGAVRQRPSTATGESAPRVGGVRLLGGAGRRRRTPVVGMHGARR